MSAESQRRCIDCSHYGVCEMTGAAQKAIAMAWGIINIKRSPEAERIIAFVASGCVHFQQKGSR